MVRHRGILAQAKVQFSVKADLWVRAGMPNPEVSGEENTIKPPLNLLKKKEADLPLDILSKIITISS